MGKFITVAIADKALYLGGELDIQAENAISACCRGRSKTSKNFIWKYE